MYRDLLKRIEDNMPNFSKGQKSIARFILEHYEKAAYMTAAVLAKQVNVSESTVVRFATELGFEGYPELMRALREVVRMKLTSVQRMELTNSIIGESDILTKMLTGDMDKISRTLEEIDKDSFDRAVDKILNANRIYIIGVRSSAYLAGFLNYNLRMVFDNLNLIQTTSASEMFEQIVDIGKDDVMFAISFPRYSKRVVNAVEFAKAKGAQVVSLTDSDSSPIAPYASELLLAKSDMVSFADSLVAPLSVINAVIAAVVRKKQSEISAKLHELEDIWDKYDVYDKN